MRPTCTGWRRWRLRADDVSETQEKAVTKVNKERKSRAKSISKAPDKRAVGVCHGLRVSWVLRAELSALSKPLIQSSQPL